MRHYLKSIIITAVTFYIIYKFVPTFNLGSDPKNMLIVVGGFWVLSQIINPIFSLVLLPINILTFGLVSAVLNVAFLFALENFVAGFTIGAYNFPGIIYEGIVVPPISFNEVTTVIIIGLAITMMQKLLHIIFE